MRDGGAMTTLEDGVYASAARSRDLFRLARAGFEDVLARRLPLNSPEFYRARSLLAEGRAALEDAKAKVKKLVGPVPDYAAREFGERRARILKASPIVVRGGDPAGIASEMASDAFVLELVPPDEIAAYVRDRFAAQSSGQRKLANFKLRMILDRLAAEAARAAELQERIRRAA